MIGVFSNRMEKLVNYRLAPKGQKNRKEQVKIT